MSCIETPDAPAWLSKLESQREKLSKARLGHDSGAGAACNSCGPSCPGLDLHFWRKTCRACHCSKDSHDVQDDDLHGWAQFELLGKPKPKRSGGVAIKIRGIADEPVKLDWVPPNVSADMVSDYMSCLGGDLAPVVGSEGAAKRREQLRRQIPLHDIKSEMCSHTLTPQEQNKHQEYISKIKNHVVGMGNIVRIGTLKKGDVFSINVENSHPVPGVKSYSLPLKVSNVSTGIKYANVPKSTSDKLLVLDNAGNVINKSGHLLDYKTSSLLSPVVKNKLNSMCIESDRIKSAVEHGPVYDKLFKDLKQLNIITDKDVYLSPIKHFRLEYCANPRFREETNAFAESQGAKIMSPITNNNKNFDMHPQKGTIFAPNGEIWSWGLTDNASTANNFEENDDVPPLPNYDTHPNYRKPDLQGLPKSMESLTDDMNNMGIVREEPHLNSKNVPCQRCQRLIKPGDVAVKAERAGKHASWHPQCFTCCKCNQLLADLVYFYHRGEIFCARDLAEALEIPRCAACDELIFSKSYTAAEGRAFHEIHFCCYHCDTPMGNQHYVPDDKTGLPICLKCYEKYHAEMCHSCKKTIEPQQQGVSWSNLHWHGICFLCSNRGCGKSLLQGKFVIKKDMPFCSSACVRVVID